jgi:hypothetical protein
VLEGEFAEGDVIEVDASKGELTFGKATAPSEPDPEPEKAAA